MNIENDNKRQARIFLGKGCLKMALKTSTALEHNDLIACGYICLQQLRIGSAIRIFDALAHRNGLIACRNKCIAYNLHSPKAYISNMLGIPNDE